VGYAKNITTHTRMIQSLISKSSQANYAKFHIDQCSSIGGLDPKPIKWRFFNNFAPNWQIARLILIKLAISGAAVAILLIGSEKS